MNFIQTFKNKFPFKLDNFQSKGIEKLYQEDSVLITARTGSGKSIFMDFCIDLALSKGKKIIITTPIKTLSNQKFSEYNKIYENVGILTGDIKYNPDGQILIMTTEILRNLLYKQNTIHELSEKKLEVNIDMKDVDSVVFDEIHYINDRDRGKVWEESIIMLPNNIKLAMLSATIDRAEEFAQWIENIKGKKVNVLSNYKRPVPLTYSIYYYTKFPKKHKKTLKLFENDTYIKRVSKQARKRLTKIYESDGTFNNDNYNGILNLINYERRNNKYYSDVDVLNKTIMFLKNQKKLPALFFIFSRKKCEDYAKKVTYTLNSPEEQLQVEKIIDDQLRLLGNPSIYLNNPKLTELKKLLIKGIGVHHSGLLPVYKEIIEILYGKKLLKVLFATETFAVGVNMPTKTVLFTSLEKFTQEGKRMLYTHEFEQLSGRAGRRGIDTHGNVMILANLMRDMPSCHKISSLMSGKSQYIESKFNFNYQFLLKTILANDINLEEFINQTLLKKNTREDFINKTNRSKQLENELQNITFTIDTKIFEQYYYLDPESKQAKHIAKRKDFEKQYAMYLDSYEKSQELEWLKEILPKMELNMEKDQMKSIEYLKENGYLKNEKVLNAKSLTSKGLVASQINECNEILFTECLTNGIFDDLNEYELAGMLGMFCDTKLQEEDKRGCIQNLEIPKIMKKKLIKVQEIANKYEKLETDKQINVRNEWGLNLDMIEYTYYWAKGTSYEDLGFASFEGNFIRDMIRVDNIAKDLTLMSEVIGNLKVMNIADLINKNIIRKFVTIDSLYVRI